MYNYIMSYSVADRFDNIYKHYGFGRYEETRSGHGSLLESTKKIREGIVSLIKDKKIKSVTDFPCGDFNWMKEIYLNFDRYVGCDISKTCIEDNKKKYPNIDFRCLNLIEDEIPDNELLFVRDVLGHCPLEDAHKIIENILKSKCRYVLTTTFAKITNERWGTVAECELPRMNENIQEHGHFYPINLMEAPFNWPLPEAFIEEDVEVINYDKGVRKALGLWEISKIKANFSNTKIVDTAQENIITKLLETISKSNSNIVIQNLTINF